MVLETHGPVVGITTQRLLSSVRSCRVSTIGQEQPRAEAAIAAPEQSFKNEIQLLL